MHNKTNFKKCGRCIHYDLLIHFIMRLLFGRLTKVYYMCNENTSQDILFNLCLGKGRSPLKRTNDYSMY